MWVWGGGSMQKRGKRGSEEKGRMLACVSRRCCGAGNALVSGAMRKNLMAPQIHVRHRTESS